MQYCFFIIHCYILSPDSFNAYQNLSNWAHITKILAKTRLFLKISSIPSIWGAYQCRIDKSIVLFFRFSRLIFCVHPLLSLSVNFQNFRTFVLVFACFYPSQFDISYYCVKFGVCLKALSLQEYAGF